MAADEILDAAWAKEHEEVDRRVALAIAAHNKEDHARFRGLVTLGADFVSGAAGTLSRCSVIVNHASFAGGGITTLDLVSTQFDPDGWADLGANTITVPDEGDYLIHSFISWGFPGGTDPTSGTYRLLGFTFSGGVLGHFHEQDPPRLLVGGDQQAQETMTFRHLSAGTVIRVQAQHDATGNMIVSGGSTHPNDLTVVQLG